MKVHCNITYRFLLNQLSDIELKRDEYAVLCPFFAQEGESFEKIKNSGDEKKVTDNIDKYGILNRTFNFQIVDGQPDMWIDDVNAISYGKFADLLMQLTDKELNTLVQIRNTKAQHTDFGNSFDDVDVENTSYAGMYVSTVNRIPEYLKNMFNL